jgi:hypothetical protein
MATTFYLESTLCEPIGLLGVALETKPQMLEPLAP